jgi:hypothetical protein
VRTLASRRAAYLLPLFDEYLIAYKDRRAAFDTSRWTRTASHDPFSAPIVIDGQVVGGWKRIRKGGSVGIALTPSRHSTSDTSRQSPTQRKRTRSSWALISKFPGIKYASAAEQREMDGMRAHSAIG